MEVCPVTTLTLNAPLVESLRDRLAHLPEFRQPEGLRHPLRAVLLIAICAILGGAPQLPGHRPIMGTAHHPAHAQTLHVPPELRY